MMKKKCKSKVPKFEYGTQQPKQAAPTPCPCELDANGDCPCDPNKPIIEGAKSNISGMLGFAGNTLFGASMTGQPDPAMGALGGAISGLTTGGGWGALLGAINGFAATGQARSDYEKLEEAKRDRYMKDRTFMPGQYGDGGKATKDNDPSKIWIAKQILLRNQGLNSVKRLMDPESFPVINNPDGTVSTHRMGYFEADGNTYMHPNLLYDEQKNELYESDNPGKEVMQVPNHLAEWISSDGYKKAAKQMMDEISKPQRMEEGGEAEYKQIQTELGESLVLPSMEISKVKAKEKHKDMDDDHVTEVVVPETIVFSAKKQLDLKKYADIELSEELSFYDDNDTYNFKDLKIGDILGKKGKISFAEAIEKVKSYYPTTKQKEHIAEQTNKLNLEARKKIVDILFKIQSGINPTESEEDEVPKAAGGWPNYKETLRQLGLLSNEDEKLTPGKTSFNFIPKNYTAGPENNLVPNDSTDYSTPDSYPLDVAGAQYKKHLLEKADTLAKEQGWTDVEKSEYINNYVPFITGKDLADRSGSFPDSTGTQSAKFNPYETLVDPNQVSPLTTDNSGRPTDPTITLQNPDRIGNGRQAYENDRAQAEVTPTSDTAPEQNDPDINDMIEKFRAKYSAQRKDLNNRFATDQNEIKTLVRKKNTNNAYQLANQALFTGLQSGYTDPALESTSLIEEQYRDVPAAVIEQQANSLASNTNSVVNALAAAGVNPGDIATYAAKSTEAVSNAQGDLRGRANDASFQNNRSKIADYRSVIQGNNQKMADTGAKLQDFNNKKLASFGEYLNAYLDNKDSIGDTNYKLTNRNEADYYDAKAAIDKGEAQLDSAKATFEINNPSSNAPKTKEELLKMLKSLSPEERDALLKQLG